MNIKKSFCSKLFQAGGIFYWEELRKEIRAFERGKILSQSLVICKGLLFFGFAFVKKYQQIANIDDSLHFLGTNSSITDFQAYNDLANFISYFFLIMNLTLLLFLLIQLIVFAQQIFQSFKIRDKDIAAIKLNIKDIQVEQRSQSKGIVMKGFSFIFGTYSYFFLPSILHFSLQKLNILGIINLSTSIIINALVNDCEYNYEIKSRDYLSCPFSYRIWLWLSGVEVSLLVGISIVDNNEFLIAGIYFFINAFIKTQISPYYYQEIQRVSIFLQIYLFEISIIAEIALNQQIADKIIFFIILIIIPFTLKATEIIIQKDQRWIEDQFQLCSNDNVIEHKGSVKQIGLVNLNKLIRLDFQSEIISKALCNQRKIKFLNFYINRKISQLSSEEKFMQKQLDQKQIILKQQKPQQSNYPLKSYKRGQTEGSNSTKIFSEFEDKQVENHHSIFSSEQEVEKEIIIALKERIKREMIHSKKKSKNFSFYEIAIYFVFLIQIAKQHILYYLLYLNVLNSSLPMKLKQILSSIHERFLMDRQIDRKQRGKLSPFDNSYAEVIVFEQKLKESYGIYEECIELKIRILYQMRQKIIQSPLLISQIKSLLQKINILQIYLNSLRLINDESIELLSLQGLFLESISFNEKDIKITHTNRFSKKIDKDDDNSSYFDSDRFNQHTCIIFARFEDVNRFIIKQVSSNFAEIFKFFSIEDVVGHSIDVLIPSFIGVKHQAYLDFFLNKNLQSYQEIEIQDDGDLGYQQFNEIGNFGFNNQKQRKCLMSQKLMFAKVNSQNIVAPVRIDIRVNSLLNDFGLTAKLKKVNFNMEYILFSEESLNVIGFTEKIKQLLIGERHIKFNLTKILPFLEKKEMRRYLPLSADLPSNENKEEEKIKMKQSEQKVISNEVAKILKENGNVNGHKIQKINEKMFFIIVQQEELNKELLASSNTIKSTKKSQKSSKKQPFSPIKQYAKTDSIYSYSFVLIEFELKKINYTDVNDISYLAISQIKLLDQNYQAQLILQYINTPQVIQLYESQIPSAELQRIISLIEKKSIFQQQQFHSNLIFSKQMNLESQYCSSQSSQQMQNSSANHKNLLKSINNSNTNNNHNKKTNSNHNQLQRAEEKSNFSHYYGTNENEPTYNVINMEDMHANDGTTAKSYKKLKKKHSISKGSSNFQEGNIKFQQQQIAEGSTTVAGGAQAQAFLLNTSSISSAKDSFGTQPNNNNISNSNNINLHAHQEISHSALNYESFIFSNNNLNAQYPFDEDNTRSFVNIDQSQSPFKKPNPISPSSTSNMIHIQNYYHISKDKMNQQSFQNNMLSPTQNGIPKGDPKFFSPRITQSSSNQLFETPLFPGKNIEQQQSAYDETQKKIKQQDYFQAESNTLVFQQMAELKSHQQLDGQHIKAQSQNLESSEQKWNNNQEDKAEKKRKVEEIQCDIASTNSKDSSQASAKKQLEQIMRDKSTLQIIKSIYAIGIICFIAIVILTLQQYLQTLTYLDNQHQDYLVFDWPTKYQSTLSVILKKQNILYMTQNNYLSFQSNDIKQAFRISTQLDLTAGKDQVIQMIKQMQSANTERKVFQLLREVYMVFQIGKQYDDSQISSTSSIPTTLVSANYNTTIENSIILAFQHVYRYSAGVGKGRPEYYMIQNQLQQISNLKKIQDEMENWQTNQENDIQNQLTQLMILIIIINGLCIGIIIPLFYYIQKQRETVVQLFGTFPTAKIDSLIQNIHNSYFHQKLTFFSIKNIQSIKQSYHKKEKDVRKQNISTVTQLPKYNCTMLAIIFISYSLIILYPILNKLITQQYLFTTLLDLETMTKVYSLRSFMLENIAIHYNIIAMKLYPTLKPQSPSIYYDYVKGLVIQNDEFNSKLDWLASQQYQQQRYDQGTYDSFFFKAVKDNICVAFQQYPQYNSNSTKINSQTCSKLNDGFLSRGVQVAYKKYLSFFPDLYNIYLITDPTQQMNTLNYFLKFLDIIDFTLFQEGLEESIVSLKSFILQLHTNYFNDIMLFQNMLVVYQIMLMILVFIVGWISFCRQLNIELHKTKGYLRAIDINTLIENSYVLTYIKKNSQI